MEIQRLVEAAGLGDQLMDKKKDLLRGAFAAALKNCKCYQARDESHGTKLWKSVLKGEKLPKEVTLISLAGDYFAFWYQEVGLPLSEDYYETAKEFFTQLYPDCKI